MGADTIIDGSATEVLAEALLLDKLESLALLLTEAESVRLPSSVDCAVTVAVTLWPAATVPIENVTTPPDCVNVPWPVVAETNRIFASSVFVRTTLEALSGPLF